MRVYQSVCDGVGHTPLVRLRHLSELTGCTIYGKLEWYNPTRSLKDRATLAMLMDAEESGLLRPGGTVIEATSGNTGLALAMLAAVRGYRCILTMPETLGVSRRGLFEALGARVELTPAGLGMAGAVARAHHLARDITGAVVLGQFDNAANPAAHQRTTGPEIWEDTDGRVNVVVAGIGTGGTISGAGRFLKAQKASIQMVGVEPEESAVLGGRAPGPHRIPGIGAGFVPRVFDAAIVDAVLSVSSCDAWHMAQYLVKAEGLMTGVSAGAAAVAAVRWLRRMELRDAVAVVILPDSGDRYWSTSLSQGDEF